MVKALPERMVSKSAFSMFLRTQCDRELYLSLFSNSPKALESSGIPVPLKSRPGVQFITNSGIAFENEQYDILATALPQNVLHADSGKTPVELKTSLAGVTKPTLILQPAFNPQEFRDAFFKNVGVDPADAKIIPPFKGLRPDIIFADNRLPNEYELRPNGSRRRLADDDKRLALCVIDLKNVREANASYSAEVCLYAQFLSNWLHELGGDLIKRFFVSDRVYLWRHVEMPEFTKLKGSKEGQDHSKRLAALRSDLGDGLISYLVYMPSVRKFFIEDLPRVIRTGDTEGWDKVEYHVNPRCSSCDWLGNTSWLSPSDKNIFDNHPEHYCSHSAETSDHLSKIASISKGASRVLLTGGHPKVANVVGIQPDAEVLRKHSLLKKDRRQLSARALSIVQKTVTVDAISKVAGLARNRNAEYDIIVNFDAGSGLITGLAVRGILFAPYEKSFPADNGDAKSFKSLGEQAFVVNKEHPTAEWAALLSFIDTLGGWMEQAGSQFETLGFGQVRTQISFWEVRQYEELCNAFGRHLIEILNLPVRAQRALAWIFPPAELMEKSDAICPNIVFIRDIVVASVHLPQRFAATLVGTAQDYFHPSMKPRTLDNYYVEPLGNGIPRERIFEIWKSPTGTVRMFGQVKSVTDAIERYGNTLKAHTWALASITAKLRFDLKDKIEGKAPALSLSIPTGLSAVAYDSKLWDRWSRVSAAVARTEALNSFVTRPEWLESSYKAIILTKLIKDHGNNQYEYEVSEDSTEAKIEEDDYLTVGISELPGFPLQHSASLGLKVADDFLYLPMHSVLLARIENFDRAKRRIVIRLSPRRKIWKPAFDAVMASDLIPITSGGLYLLESMSYDDSAQITDILRHIGNPAIASPAKAALDALGVAASKKIKSGTDPLTPAALVLWQGGKLAAKKVRSDQAIEEIVKFATNANLKPLNESQIKAVSGCASSSLAVIWGPPGTGKTETLVALLHAIVRENIRRNILIAGPNYRAVEELSRRLAENLNKDDKAVCDFYWLYSRTRTPSVPPPSEAHLNLVATNLDNNNSDFNALLNSVADDQRVTIVATTSHIVDQFTKAVSGNALAPVFDFIVLDESSQIPISLALKPLAALKPDAQLIIAGDHMQMPPIQRLEPPTNAEYLVNSIQTYLLKRFKIVPHPLLINYRSNQDLVEYAKSLDYPANLVAYSPKKDLKLLHPIKDAIAKLPAGLPTGTVYENVLAPAKRVVAVIHEDPTSSQANELEAGLVAGLAFSVRHCMAAELDLGDACQFSPFTDDLFFSQGIGIVTPHKAQKALVLRKLRELFPKTDEEKIFAAVDTVERFQGGERNTIIVSYGVGDTDIIEGEEHFLLQLERTNVAVSRAKAKCIVIMPKSLAYHLPTDIKAAETSIALKSYLEEFCNKREKIVIEYLGNTRKAEVRWH